MTRPDATFWRGRRVLLTGHSGFKGAWAGHWLKRLGAEVHGLSLPGTPNDALYRALGNAGLASETWGDVADPTVIAAALDRAKPEVVLHLAAQALVGAGHADPLGTIRTNTLGTATLLDGLRGARGLTVVLIVTTDKVYANPGTGEGFAEDAALGDDDPYAASKAAAEIVTRAFRRSFFEAAGVPVATARAGNTIGGGDWAPDRLVPNILRAVAADEPVRLRAPCATRPWQHVLDVTSGYLRLVERLAIDPACPRALNFGPSGASLPVSALAERMIVALGGAAGWVAGTGSEIIEATHLALDSQLAARALGWRTLLSGDEAIDWTARWYTAHARGDDARDLCERNIAAFEAIAA